MTIKHLYHSFVFLFFGSCIGYGCQTNSKEEISLTAMETAQQFIRLEMNGDFTNARTYVVSTDYNSNKIAEHQKRYDALSEEIKKQLKSENINIESYEEVSDSTAILSFSNSIDTGTQKLYLSRQNKKWSIDFKSQNQ